MMISAPGILGCREFYYDAYDELGSIKGRDEFDEVHLDALSDLDKIMGGYVYTFYATMSYYAEIKNVSEKHYEERVNSVVMFMEFLKKHVEIMGEIYYTEQWMGVPEEAETVEVRDVHIEDMKYGPGTDDFEFELGIIYRFTRK